MYSEINLIMIRQAKNGIIIHGAGNYLIIKIIIKSISCNTILLCIIVEIIRKQVIRFLKISIFGARKNKILLMPQVYKIRKGLNISLAGKAEKFFGKAESFGVICCKTIDFHGLVPKLEVKEGSEVKAEHLVC